MEANCPGCREHPRGCGKLGPQNERGSQRGLEMERAPLAREPCEVRAQGGSGFCGARALLRTQSADSSATQVADKRSVAKTGS